MTTARRRFWAVYNIAVLVLIMGTGVIIILGGGARGLLGGGAMLMVGAYLATRTRRAARGRGEPQVSDLRIGPEGVLVLSGDPQRPGRAFLPWEACVAVVASPVVSSVVGPEAGAGAGAGALPGGQGLYYLHFMPARDSAVVLTDVPGQLLRGKAALVDLPITSGVAMVWLGSEAQLPQIFATLEHVRSLRPGLRVVDSIRRSQP